MSDILELIRYVGPWRIAALLAGASLGIALHHWRSLLTAVMA